jgi:hypothetical protein
VGLLTFGWVLNLRNGLCIVQVYIGALKGVGDAWEWEDGTAWNFNNFLAAEGGGLSNTCVANCCTLCIVYFPVVTI